MNNDEFREKLLASFPGLRQHTHRLTTSSDDADDLMQETLLTQLCLSSDDSFCLSVICRFSFVALGTTNFFQSLSF